MSGATHLAELLGGGDRAAGQAIVAKARGWLGLARDDHPIPSSASARSSIPDSQNGDRGIYGNGAGADKAGDEKAEGSRDVPLEPLEQVEQIALQPRFGGRMFDGMLVIVERDPRLGKSNMVLDLGCRISTGRPYPDESPAGSPGAVLFFTSEDDIARTIKPRVTAMGGDQSRIYGISTWWLPDPVTGEVGKRMPTLRDVDWLERQIVKYDARLVVFDPLPSYLPPGVRANNDSEMRQVLTPLALVAERTGTIIILIRHLNKSGQGPAIYRGGGSIGIIGAARCALLVAADPNDRTWRVVACNKNNLGPEPSALAFQIVGGPGGMPILRGWKVVDFTANQLLASQDQPVSRQQKRRDARTFLEAELADGPVPAREVLAHADAEGIGKHAIERAKGELALRWARDGTGPGSVIMWNLPTPLPMCPPGLLDPSIPVS